MVEIKPHLGRCRDVVIDTGIDAVYVIERGARSLVGFVGREPNASLALIVSGLAPAVVEECKRVARSRDCEKAPATVAEIVEAGPDLRQVVTAPAVEHDEGEEDDDAT